MGLGALRLQGKETLPSRGKKSLEGDGRGQKYGPFVINIVWEQPGKGEVSQTGYSLFIVNFRVPQLHFEETWKKKEGEGAVDRVAVASNFCGHRAETYHPTNDESKGGCARKKSKSKTTLKL